MAGVPNARSSFRLFITSMWFHILLATGQCPTTGHRGIVTSKGSRPDTHSIHGFITNDVESNDDSHPMNQSLCLSIDLSIQLSAP